MFTSIITIKLIGFIKRTMIRKYTLIFEFVSRSVVFSRKNDFQNVLLKYDRNPNKKSSRRNLRRV